MRFKAKTVGDLINFEYAKFIAIAIHGTYPNSATPEEVRRLFWGTLRATKTKLDTGAISPSALLRENKKIVKAGTACAYCGIQDNLEWEHVIPKSRGGSDNIDNLVLACRECNAAKGTKDVYMMYRGRTHEAPRVVWGKYLKQLRDAHHEAGTWDASEYPTGHGLSRASLAKVFLPTQ